jgi:hypothetical protein
LHFRFVPEYDNCICTLFFSILFAFFLILFLLCLSFSLYIHGLSIGYFLEYSKLNSRTRPLKHVGPT